MMKVSSMLTIVAGSPGTTKMQMQSRTKGVMVRLTWLPITSPLTLAGFVLGMAALSPGALCDLEKTVMGTSQRQT
jgi:hypothetical protein